MFTTYVPSNGSEQSYRYTRSVNGRETWTPRQSYGPRDEMTAKYDGKCRLPNCGNREIVANVTTIKKVAGQWNHKSCPKATPQTARQEFTAAMKRYEEEDREMARMEAAADRQDAVQAAQSEMARDEEAEQDAIYAALEEYNRLQRQQAVAEQQAALFANEGVYRVSLTGDEKRYGIDHVNVELTPNVKYGNLKVKEYRGIGVGRVERDGTVKFWNDVDQNDARVKAVVAAVRVILKAADPVEFAKAFAVASSKCMRCGDDLVDDESRARLLGPVCVKKWKW